MPTVPSASLVSRPSFVVPALPQPGPYRTVGERPPPGAGMKCAWIRVPSKDEMAKSRAAASAGATSASGHERQNGERDDGIVRLRA